MTSKWQEDSSSSMCHLISSVMVALVSSHSRISPASTWTIPTARVPRAILATIWSSRPIITRMATVNSIKLQVKSLLPIRYIVRNVGISPSSSTMQPNWRLQDQQLRLLLWRNILTQRLCTALRMVRLLQTSSWPLTERRSATSSLVMRHAITSRPPQPWSTAIMLTI